MLKAYTHISLRLEVEVSGNSKKIIINFKKIQN